MTAMTTYSDTLDSAYTKNIVNSVALRRDFNTGTSYDGSPVNRSIQAESFTWDRENSYHHPIMSERAGCCDKNNKEQVNSKTDLYKNKRISIIINLWNRIDRLKTYGVDWVDDDIEIGPTEEIIKKVRDFIPQLINNDLIPFRITPSIDEGICVAFRKERILIYIEFYNDGDIGMIAEDYIRKKILKNVDLDETDIIPALNKIIK